MGSAAAVAQLTHCTGYFQNCGFSYFGSVKSKHRDRIHMFLNSVLLTLHIITLDVQCTETLLRSEEKLLLISANSAENHDTLKFSPVSQEVIIAVIKS